MKHAFACALLFCLVSGGIAAAEQKTHPAKTPQSREHTMTKKDESDVRAVVEKMTADFQNNQIDAVMGAYEHGAAVLFEPGKPVTDEAMLRQMFGGMAAVKPVFKYAGHEVVVTGDTAVHIAPWQMTAHAPDGKTITQSGLSVAVLRRQSDGSWKMVIDNPHGGHLLPSAN